jgi:AraC-like DNA-binding protein
LNDFEETRIATSDYYIGKSFFELNKKRESLIHFKEVDSIIHLTNDVTPELIDSYNYLIDDSKSKKNLKSQIEYINSLIKFDSVLDNNYKYVKNTLVKKYDTPELVLEKERLIKQLNNSYSLSKDKIIILSMIIIFLIIILFYSIRKSIINKKKFELIKANLNTDIKEENKEDLIKVTTTTTTTTGLPENLVKEILFSLDKFESSNKFAKKHYTLNTLAKELNTNSSYLSKVINATKKVNFANYLNNLKIDLAMKRLAQEKQFRSFTIKAIAEDSGFNNAQSFSVAFHKKTGLYPSYFIKKLNTNK